MTTVLTDSANYTAIANAIRSKNGSSDTYTPAQMATAISNIATGTEGIIIGDSAPSSNDGVDGDYYLQYRNVPERLIGDGNSYINTGIIIDNTHTLEAEVSLTEVRSNYEGLFGSIYRISSGRYNFDGYPLATYGAEKGYYAIMANNSDGKLFMLVNTDGNTNYVNVMTDYAKSDFYNTLHTIKMEYNSSDNEINAYVDSTKYQLFSGTPTTLGSSDRYPYFLFAINHGLLSREEFKSKSAISRFSVSNSSGTLLMELTPHIDDNDVVCMHDEVTGNNFYNQGSGTFSYSGEVRRFIRQYKKVNGAWVNSLNIS